jgi:hypothetical protein
LGEVIEQPAGRGDDDVGAAPEGRNLRAETDAAVDRGDLRHFRVAREGSEMFGDLRGEFAGRRQDERARFPPRQVDQALEQRQAEGGRFAAAGSGARSARRAPRWPAGSIRAGRASGGEAQVAHRAQQLRP